MAQLEFSLGKAGDREAQLQIRPQKRDPYLIGLRFEIVKIRP